MCSGTRFTSGHGVQSPQRRAMLSSTRGRLEPSPSTPQSSAPAPAMATTRSTSSLTCPVWRPPVSPQVLCTQRVHAAANPCTILGAQLPPRFEPCDVRRLPNVLIASWADQMLKPCSSSFNRYMVSIGFDPRKFVTPGMPNTVRLNSNSNSNSIKHTAV